MRKNLQNRTGFTLTELLVTVVIISILAAMAIPMYERAIEKSHRTEVSATLLRLSEAKMRLMQNMDISHFSGGSNPSFKAKSLDSTFTKNSGQFRYSLYPSENYRDAVCAERTGGKYAGTIFLYLGEAAADCNCTNAGSTTPCGIYCTTNERMFCYKSNDANGQACAAYGMDNSPQALECADVFD